MDIDVKVISHKEQRYPTVGDWWFDNLMDDACEVIIDTILRVRVSSMNNPHYEFLVARHEIDEAFLCKARGIYEEDVTVFDKMYEDRRKAKDPEFQGECGDHKLAPYRKEHFFATTQERAMAAELEVDWEEYDRVVSSL